MSHPTAIAVNAVTNKIYVAHRDDDKMTVVDGASHATETIDVGDGPIDIAVNGVTNKIYVANMAGDDVTVIDGADHSTETVEAGDEPYRISVNAVTDKIYVVNKASHNVTVINGADNSTEIVEVGNSPFAIAVNTITNKVYVANQGGSSVSVIDGATNEVETIATGGTPFGIAVNPIANKIYVSNYSSDDVTVIDGADNTTVTVSVGDGPRAIAVNPVTNKIYVTNSSGNTVTVVDGADRTTESVATGSFPVNLAVNEVTNKIYVSAESSDTITVIDGADNSAVSLTAGNGPRGVAVNPATNKIYVMNFASDDVTVIDGDSNTTESVTVGDVPGDIAVNPVTNRIYVSNQFDDSATVIDGSGRTPNPLQVEIVPLPGHVASGTNASFTFRMTNAYSPNPTRVLGLYYQLDDTRGEWKRADASGEDWAATVSSATYGSHVLYAMALEAQGDGVTAGIASAYAFNILPENTISPAASSFDKNVGAAAHASVTTTLTLNGYPLASIASGATPLVRDTDYSVTGNTVTIKKEFLAAQPVGTVNLTFTFDSGATLTLPVTVIDSTPPPPGPDPGPGPGDQDEPSKDPEPETEIVIEKGIIVIKVAPKDVKEVKQGDGRVIDQVELPQKVVDKLPKLLDLAERPFVRVVINDRKPDVNLQLPAALVDMAQTVRSDVVFEARLNGSSFQLEVNVLDPKQLAAKLGVDVKDMKVNIFIRTLAGSEREELAAAARKQGMTMLSEAIEFQLLVSGGGQTLEVSDFGGTYMMKSIVLDADAARRNYTAVLYDPIAQSFTFVPAVTDSRSDGRSESVMRMPHNSIYAVMESDPISFADLQGHWAKSPVEQMASKRIIFGVSQAAYAPDRAITRAEFTALLVRALGIRAVAVPDGDVFEDVAASAWYASAVEAGARSRLVSGIGGARFAPEERITREQMAVMLANARALAADRAAAGAEQSEELPSRFGDAAEVSPWARTAMAEAVAAGIIQGLTPDRLAPAESATRAQAAVMLKRLMEEIGFLE